MNTNFCIIVILLVLIIIASVAIYNAHYKSRESFHTDVICSDIRSESVCNAHNECNYDYKERKCYDSCKFDNFFCSKFDGNQTGCTGADKMTGTLKNGTTKDQDVCAYATDKCNMQPAFNCNTALNGVTGNAEVKKKTCENIKLKDVTQLCHWDGKECMFRDGRKHPDSFERNGSSAKDRHGNSSCNAAGTKYRLDGGINGTNKLKSRCSSSQIVARCSEYSKKGVDDPNYEEYPHDKISGEEYIKIRQQLLDRLGTDIQDPDLNKSLRDNLGFSNIKSEVDKLSGKSEELNTFLTNLEDLNNTGSEFVSQVNELKDFQSKYSTRLQEILNRNKKTDSESEVMRLNIKLKALEHQLENILPTPGSDGNNTPDTSTHPFRKATRVGNPKLVLSINPVTYVDGANKRIYKNNGAYTISVKKLTQNGYVQYVRVKPDNSSPPKICNSSCMANCDFKLRQVIDGDDTDKVKIEYENNDTFADLKTHYAWDANTGIQEITAAEWNDEIEGRRKDFYFWIRRINNWEDYKSVLVLNPEPDLVEKDERYPFYVIETVNRRGYLVNLDGDSPTDMKLSIRPAGNTVNEKFHLSTLVKTC